MLCFVLKKVARLNTALQSFIGSKPRRSFPPLGKFFIFEVPQMQFSATYEANFKGNYCKFSNFYRGNKQGFFPLIWGMEWGQKHHIFYSDMCTLLTVAYIVHITSMATWKCRCFTKCRDCSLYDLIDLSMCTVGISKSVLYGHTCNNMS